MPKIVSRSEKDLIYEDIYEGTINLITKKGLKGITVDDIIKATKMAKGSFYKYYPSKEECLYDVILKYERKLLEKMKPIFSEQLTKREKYKKILKEVYLADDSLVLYVKPEDIWVLIRKLPAEYTKKNQTKAIFNFEYILQMFGINRKKIKMEVLDYLVSSLHYIASRGGNTTERKIALDLLVNSIVEYLINGEN